MYIKIIVYFHFAHEIEVTVCHLAQSALWRTTQQTWASTIRAVKALHLPQKPRAVLSLHCFSPQHCCAFLCRLPTISGALDRAVYRNGKQLPVQLRDTLWLGVRQLPRLWLFYFNLLQQTNTKCLLYAGQGPGAP